MLKYDSQVQINKMKVLKEVAKEQWKHRLLENITEIPKRVIPGPKPQYRCCIYKERAIIAERVKLAVGGNRENKNVIEVIEIACDECPVGGYVVTDICRGCLAHKCETDCKKNAIVFGKDGRAEILKQQCVECGLCAKACPYSAIYNRKRPCENACKIKAISMGDNGAAKIDEATCTACGACATQCPFGAIVDKSYILNVIDYLTKSRRDKSYNVYAVLAPAFASQFQPATPKQVLTGIKKLGFDYIVEAALGADMIALKESEELAERNGEAMTSSCCPAFVQYIRTAFPQLADRISTNLSPMAEISKVIKEKEPSAKVVFIGPCTAKKMEIQWPSVKPYVDSAITFEELAALFEARNIDVFGLEETEIEDASKFGRSFALSGGVSEAVKAALIEQNIDFEVKPVVCQGLDQCKQALQKMAKGVLDGNFIEGMACQYGCVGGAGNITRSEKGDLQVAKFAKESEKTIK